MSYAIVMLVAALVGVVELIARYRDAPTDVLRRLPAVFYITINVVGEDVLRASVEALGDEIG